MKRETNKHLKNWKERIECLKEILFILAVKIGLTVEILRTAYATGPKRSY